MTEYGQTLMAQGIVDNKMELKVQAQQLGHYMSNLLEDNLTHLCESLFDSS